MNKRWRIEMLGSLRVTSPAGEVVRFPTRKSGELLAMLALRPNEKLQREEVASLLWPRSESSDARRTLRITLNRLRNALQAAGPGDDGWLKSDASTLRIDPARFETDAAQFTAHLQHATGAATTAARACHLGEAVELYRGPLLQGLGEEWANVHARQWENEFFAAADELLTLLEAAGDAPRALRHALHILTVDPLRETSHAAVLRLHVTLGQTDSALAHYHTCFKLFRKELDRSPSMAVTGIVEPLLRRKPVGRPRKPAQPTAVATTRWPGGTVTLLLLDNLAPGQANRRDSTYCRARLRELIARHGGHEISGLRPDAIWAVFGSAGDAMECAVAMRRAACDVPRLNACCHTMRIALDTGDSGQWTTDEAGTEPTSFNRATLDRALELQSAGDAGQTLCSAVTAALLRRALPHGVMLDDLGIFRINPSAPPERIFQLSWQGMPQRRFEAPRLAPLLSGELPAPLTSFFGREAELRQIVNATARARLVTLTGFGGCGKTRLAIEAAHRLKATFHGAAWFVPLDGVRDPEGIAPAIVQALQLPGAQGLEPWRAALGALGSASALLVLDNFEQVAAGGAEVLRRLLGEAPGVTLLVTSRHLLGLDGEAEIGVRPLPLPPHQPALPDCAQHKRWRSAIDRTPSLQLFVDRARAAQPHFTLNQNNEASVVALCHALEGIPLAIELAAAHCRTLSPGQMLTMFEGRLGRDQLSLLQSHHGETPDRHRTLAAAIDWSYALQSPSAADLFARLSVFHGGWTVPAAQAVAAPPLAAENDALHALFRLQDASLIFSDDAPGEVRFAMLEMLRQYGAAKLSSAQSATLAARHATFFAELAEVAGGNLMSGGRDQWLQTLDAEAGNLRAALRWFLENNPARCVQMAGALWRFWEARGAFAEGRDWLERALNESEVSKQKLGQTVSPAHRVRALNGAGRMAWYRADFAAAHRFLEECLKLAPSLDAPPATRRKTTADALHSLGLVAMCQGDAAAPMLLAEGLALVRENGDRRVVKDFLLGLGLVRFQLALPGAAALFKESLDISRELGDQRGMAFAITNLGLLALEENRGGEARALLEQALPLLCAMGDQWSSARALQGLGRVAYLENDWPSAREYFRENLRILAEAGSHWELVYTLPCFAKMALEQNKPRSAARLLGAAQSLLASTHHELFPVARAAFAELLQRTEAAVSAAYDADTAQGIWLTARMCSRDEAIAEAMTL